MRPSPPPRIDEDLLYQLRQDAFLLLLALDGRDGTYTSTRQRGPDGRSGVGQRALGEAGEGPDGTRSVSRRREGIVLAQTSEQRGGEIDAYAYDDRRSDPQAAASWQGD